MSARIRCTQCGAEGMLDAYTVIYCHACHGKNAESNASLRTANAELTRKVEGAREVIEDALRAVKSSNDFPMTESKLRCWLKNNPEAHP